MKRLLNPFKLAGPLALGLCCVSQADVPSDNANVVVVEEGKLLCWDGQPGRTYFIQTSDPNEVPADTLLQSWLWWPDIIETGVGAPIQHEIVTTADKAFFRIWHTEESKPPGETLEDWDADYDGLSNALEISKDIQTNPVEPDTDGDGLLDGFEVNNGLDPHDDGTGDINNGPQGDPDGDGWTNLQEQDARTNPKNWDTDGDGIQDSTDSDPLANNAIDNPDGEGLPAGLDSGLLGRWDFESVTSTGSPYRPYNNANEVNPACPAHFAGILDADGMVSKCADHTNDRYAVVDANVMRPNFPSGPPSYNQFALSMWFRIEKDLIKNQQNNIYKCVWAVVDNVGTSATGNVLAVRKSGSMEEWYIGAYQWDQNGGAPLSTFDGKNFTFALGTHDDGRWHHLVLTRNQPTYRIYIDGTERFNNSVTFYGLNWWPFNPIPNTPATLMLFGRFRESFNYNQVNGNIDRVRLYSRNLSATEALDLYHQDIDHDGLWDLTEQRSLLWRDDNSDGIRTTDETEFTMNPFYWDDPNSDHDDDDLTSLYEQNVSFTNAAHPDTDGDLLPDGWENTHGLDPNDATGNDGANGDRENGGTGDGVTNLDEFTYQTNPNSSDSDGDGTGDAAEVAQGSHPGDARDGGQPPPAWAQLSIKLGIGDRSGSDSEDYVMNVFRLDPETGQEVPYLVHRSGGHGQYFEKTYPFFWTNDTYTFQIDWQSSTQSARNADPVHGVSAEGPDFDYHMVVEPQSVDPGILVDSLKLTEASGVVHEPILDLEDINPEDDDDDNVDDFQETIEPRRVLLANPALVGYDGEGELTKLAKPKVAKWEFAFEDSEFGGNYATLRDNFIELDPDRFHVVFPNIAGAEITIGTRTNDSPTLSFQHDDQTRIAADVDQDRACWLRSLSQILVATELDDDLAIKGVGADDEANNDRTHQVYGFGPVRVTASVPGVGSVTQDFRRPSKSGAAIDEAVIVRDLDGTAPMTSAEFYDHVRAMAHPRFLQADTYVFVPSDSIRTIDRPAGMTSDAGLLIKYPSVMETQAEKFEEALLPILQVAGTQDEDDMQVFLFSGVRMEGFAFDDEGILRLVEHQFAFGYNEVESGALSPKASWTIYYSPNNLNPSTGSSEDEIVLAHEIGHLLANAGHYDGVNKWVNLMHEHAMVTIPVGARAAGNWRLFDSQQTAIEASLFVHESE